MLIYEFSGAFNHIIKKITFQIQESCCNGKSVILKFAVPLIFIYFLKQALNPESE